MEQQQTVLGWAARDATGLLSPFTFSLRARKEDDIIVKILYCGICHTDLSTIKNEWGNARYPVVPGHEIVGIVIELGSKVGKFRAGDKVGIGYMAASCLTCGNCKQDQENYCSKIVPSFNSTYPDGTKTFGGFSDTVVINEHFAVQIPDNLPLHKVGPLMCAGITVYTPMKYFGLDEPSKHLGVVGLGGLGHMAVKFGKAFGMRVTVISSTASKEKEALEKLGADSFLISHEPQQILSAAGMMDGIIDTVSVVHPLEPLISLLKVHGKLIIVGGPDKPLELPVFSLVLGGKCVAGSCIGGMKDTQHMINFAAENSIAPEVEVIGMDYVNTAIERLQKGDVRYRFVIDVASTIAAN